MIVGPHGGGLMNMIYARPHTTVIVFPTLDWSPSSAAEAEASSSSSSSSSPSPPAASSGHFVAPAAFDEYFSHACAALRLNYVCVPEVSAGFYENYTLTAANVDQVEAIVARVLASPSPRPPSPSPPATGGAGAAAGAGHGGEL